MITTTKIDKVQKEIKIALAKIEKANKVNINFGRVTYNDINYGTRMTVTTSEKSKAVNKAKGSENLMLSRSYGFDKNIVGETFVSNGRTFEVTQFKTRNRKYPIIATTQGKGYKFEASVVKRLMK
jgi:hypothetical protein